MSDFKFALRQLARSPGFTTVAIVSLALEKNPGARGATLSQFKLLGGAMSGGSFLALSAHPELTEAQRPQAHRLTVSETFFATMDIPIMHGRPLGAGDVDGGTRVVVVNQAFARAYFAVRTNLPPLALLAALAVLLSCIGIYGLMAYNVARRTGEFGVRMALGATPARVARPVLREAVVLALLGVAIGVPLAGALAQVIRNQLFGVPAFDPVSLAGGAVVLLAVAVAAAWIPAQRAARVDPMTALRAE